MKSIINLIVNQFTFFPHNKIRLKQSEWQSYVSQKWINTEDGEKLQSLYFEHKDNKPKSLIIYFHGNTGNLFSHNRYEHANEFYKMGCNVLLLSYRGFSKSSGSVSEDGIFMDGEAAVQYAKKYLGYSVENTFIIGRSLGTTVATHVAQNKTFKGVVLITPLTNARDIAKTIGFSYVSFLVKNRLNSLRKIKHLKSKLLIIGGTVDRVTPFEMSVKLFNKYKGPKKLITIKNGGHNNLQLVNPKAFWNSIKNFVND